MRIWTSRYAQAGLPEAAAAGVAMIGITRLPARWRKGYSTRLYRKLAPADEAWGLRGDWEQYRPSFEAQLAMLDAHIVEAELRELAGDAEDVVLLCFEDLTLEGAWCHRTLVAGWLERELGIRVREWGC